ncbi:unnamed protein product [Protopolystoma xenopodis]|uniref:CHCH domain-containing protein n=1 Tax=Protopolystoma xenopodis TaxID=117903 RepID=A0A448WA29_9PLAT|nr:unnamed protein product [Protopolystoma xenopodis]
MATSTRYTHGVLTLTPPEKGSFPLDHKGICTDLMLEWTKCMSKSQWCNEKCHIESAAYLHCRIRHGLMAPEEPQRLGFTPEEWDQASRLSMEK